MSDETTDDLRRLLHHDRYPMASAYDPRWVIDNQMGPHALWLLEALVERMELEPGMRVLDLGSGRAITSIMLARDYGVRVVAGELWTPPSQNWVRVVEVGVADAVLPMHLEAHDLPFADGYFDAVISIDAYHYFGTADLYLPTLTRVLRPGGHLGIVCPGLVAELPDGPPDHLLPYWEWEFRSFHSARWWRQLWESTGLVRVDHAEDIPGAVADWRRWLEITAEHGDPQWRAVSRHHAEMLDVDAGRTFSFPRVVARVPD